MKQIKTGEHLSKEVERSKKQVAMSENLSKQGEMNESKGKQVETRGINWKQVGTRWGSPLDLRPFLMQFHR